MLLKCGLLQGCCHGARFTATPFSCCPRARHISISAGQQSATRKRSASAQEVFLSTICCREIEARHCWPVENLQVHHPYHQQTKFSQCVPHAHDRTVVTDTSHLSNDFHRLCTPRKSITSAGTNVRGVVSIMPRLMCRPSWDGPLTREDVRNAAFATLDITTETHQVFHVLLFLVSRSTKRRCTELASPI